MFEFLAALLNRSREPLKSTVAQISLIRSQPSVRLKISYISKNI